MKSKIFEAEHLLNSCIFLYYRRSVRERGLGIDGHDARNLFGVDVDSEPRDSSQFAKNSQILDIVFLIVAPPPFQTYRPKGERSK